MNFLVITRLVKFTLNFSFSSNYLDLQNASLICVAFHNSELYKIKEMKVCPHTWVDGMERSKLVRFSRQLQTTGPTLAFQSFFANEEGSLLDFDVIKPRLKGHLIERQKLHPLQK